jgi:hypothetical protein
MAQSQVPERGNLSYYSQQNTKRRRVIQWDNTQNKIREYNPISTPTQMFSHSTLLHPSQPNPFQPDNIQTTQTSKLNHNPFNRLKSTPYSTNQRPRDGKFRGGRRGFSPRH